MRWMPIKDGRRDRRRPERRRNELMRALSDRLSDLDLPKIDRPRVDLPNVDLPRMDLSRVDLPRVDLPRVDLRRAMEEAAIRAGVRERTRSRWPIVAVVVIAGIVALVALLRRPAVRAQVEETARRTRVRIEQMRLERETKGLSVEDIEHAVGDTNGSGEGQEPVAVGPGPDPAAGEADADGVASPAPQETAAAS